MRYIMHGGLGYAIDNMADSPEQYRDRFSRAALEAGRPWRLEALHRDGAVALVHYYSSETLANESAQAGGLNDEQ